MHRIAVLWLSEYSTAGCYTEVKLHKRHTYHVWYIILESSTSDLTAFVINIIYCVSEECFGRNMRTVFKIDLRFRINTCTELFGNTKGCFISRLEERSYNVFKKSTHNVVFFLSLLGVVLFSSFALSKWILTVFSRL